MHLTCLANGIDGVYNKQGMHVYHVITRIYKSSINRKQPYFQNKADLKHSNKIIRYAIHGHHQKNNRIHRMFPILPL